MSASSAGSSQLAPGYRLDRYELICPVAQGGMAAVWLARFQGKHGFEKLVAVKTILPLYADDAQFRQMFLDEATIASRIEHGNVAQILDLGEHDGTLYLVMEWVDGDSVSRLERATQQIGTVIPQAIALRIASDCCAGLNAAHELCDARGRSLGVVHRDVSPQNVLVTAKGLVKLIDFGIAKARDRAAEETRTGVFKGKLHYMAPEQALGKSLDHRADIWAVAALTYRLLAQRPVYDAGNRIDTLRELTTNAPIAPLPLQVPQRISEILLKALSFEPEARYATCAELQSELDRASAAESLLATPAELGAFVHQHLGDRLDARRQLITASVQSLSDGDQVSAAALPSDLENTEPRPGLTGSEVRSEATRIWSQGAREGSLTTNSTSVSEELRGPSPRRVRGAAAFAGVTALVVMVVFWLRASPSNEAQPSAASAQASAHPVTVPVPALSAPADLAERPRAPEPNVVSLESLPLTAEPKAIAAMPSKAHVVRPAPHAKQKRKIVDDGF